jgi:hypothetical protein
MEQLFWTADKLATEGSFHLACNIILAECTEAYRAGDLATLDRLVSRMDAAAPLATREPLISRFEYTYAIVLLHVGLALASSGDFDYAFLIANYVEGLRQYSRTRRMAMGLPLLHNTEVRYLMLNLLGDLKKQAKVEFRDAVLTPAMMWEEWKIAADRALDYIQSYSPERAAKVRHDLGWAGVQVIECATRFMPPLEVTGMISHFNRRFGQHLAASAGHFNDNPPLCDSAWYWDYEIYKLDFAGKLDPEVMHELIERRDRCVRVLAKKDAYDLTSYTAGVVREKRALAERAKLSIVEAKRAS